MNTVMVVAGILVAAVANMIVGMAWYSPAVFGQAWMRLGKISFNPNDPNMKQEVMKSFVIALITSIIMASVMLCFMYRMNITGIIHGILFGKTVWLGFSVPGKIGSVLWERRPWKLFFLNTAHDVVALSVMGAILSFFVGYVA
jgi:ABC-type Fe3+ transport system permease subunit